MTISPEEALSLLRRWFNQKIPLKVKLVPGSRFSLFIRSNADRHRPGGGSKVSTSARVYYGRCNLQTM
jgi:hypothetical protein